MALGFSTEDHVSGISQSSFSGERKYQVQKNNRRWQRDTVNIFCEAEITIYHITVSSSAFKMPQFSDCVLHLGDKPCSRPSTPPFLFARNSDGSLHTCILECTCWLSHFQALSSLSNIDILSYFFCRSAYTAFTGLKSKCQWGSISLWSLSKENPSSCFFRILEVWHY